MKKITLLILLLFPIITTTAQEPRFTFGVSTGINQSFPTFDIWDWSDQDKKQWEIPGNSEKGLTGFQIGLDAEYRLTNTFYLQSGLYYTTRRTKLEYLDIGTPSGLYYYTDKFNTGYLKVPLLVALKTRLSTKALLYFRGGSYFAQGISGKFKSTKTYIKEEGANGIITQESHSLFGKSYFQRFDWGLSFGAGIEIHRFVVGVDYDLGLQNILKNYDLYLLESNKVKNRSLSLMAGYRF